MKGVSNDFYQKLRSTTYGALIAFMLLLAILIGCNTTITNNNSNNDDEPNNTLFDRWRATHVNGIPVNEYFVKRFANAELENLNCDSYVEFRESNIYESSFICSFGDGETEVNLDYGTYTIDGDSLITTSERYNDSGEWVTIDEADRVTLTVEYTLSGDTLTIRDEEETIVYERT